MNLLLLRKTSAFAITLIIMGVLVQPTPANAGFGDILGSLGLGSYSQPSASSSYDYNSTASQHQGNIEISKEGRRVGQDSHYNSDLTVRSGGSVEIIIEVQNTSKVNAPTIIRDELGGSVVYVPNTLRVGGQASKGGLTSGGLQVNIPAKSKLTITYQISICGGSGYATHASAYSAGIGSATDGMIIRMEDQNQNYYVDNVSTCLSQFQTNNGTKVNSGNSFGEWTGVNNSTAVTPSSNPFDGWTGVNSATTTSTTTNPFTGWTGVDNSKDATSTTSSAFGEWTGVDNSKNITSSSNDPFGVWTGVNSHESNTNPFGDWAGSGNNVTPSNGIGSWNGVASGQTNSNPFGDWQGVSSTDDGYDASGYSTNGSNNQVAFTAATASSTPTTNFVAPTTGVNPIAPFAFAGMLTAGFVVFRKRKFIFN